MFYLSEWDVNQVGLRWEESIGAVEDAARSLVAGDFAQPIKPFLRFRDPGNRIIAMPAFVGGRIEAAGVKWVSSFPGNVNVGMPRAHCIVILNDPETGVPRCVVNAPSMNGIRTAAVSGWLVRKYLEARPRSELDVGIVGWGPIGRLHAAMCAELLRDRLRCVRYYDIRSGRMERRASIGTTPIRACESWEEVYTTSDVFITCTVTKGRYVIGPPREGALLLNVSLRDFDPSIVEHTRAIVVDDWEEVCREDTDIERLHVERGLDRDGVQEFREVAEGSLSRFAKADPIFVCPMGMAVFDVAVASWYVAEAARTGLGRRLP